MRHRRRLARSRGFSKADARREADQSRRIETPAHSLARRLTLQTTRSCGLPRSTCTGRAKCGTACPWTNETRQPARETSMASVSHGLLTMVLLVVSLTRKTSTSVWSICAISSGRDAAYSPGRALVALTPFASLRFKAIVRRSMRSTRALIVRRSGSGKSFHAQSALFGRSGFRYISWIADAISRSLRKCQSFSIQRCRDQIFSTPD